MELKPKQRLEKNKITFVLGCLILGAIDILTLLGFADAAAKYADCLFYYDFDK